MPEVGNAELFCFVAKDVGGLRQLVGVGILRVKGSENFGASFDRGQRRHVDFIILTKQSVRVRKVGVEDLGNITVKPMSS